IFNTLPLSSNRCPCNPLAKSCPCMDGAPALYSGPCAVDSVTLQGKVNTFGCAVDVWFVFVVCAKEVCDKLTKVTYVKRRVKDRIVIKIVTGIAVNLLSSLSVSNVIDSF